MEITSCFLVAPLLYFLYLKNSIFTTVVETHRDFDPMLPYCFSYSLAYCMLNPVLDDQG